MKKAALILINLQNDFMPTGSVSIPNGHEVIPIANQLMHHFSLVVATKDWHPRGHYSFASQHSDKKPGDKILFDGRAQELWPDHCIQDTYGAELTSELDQSGIDHIFHKGAHPHVDSYSAFLDNHQSYATGLHTLLKFHKINNVFVLGLTTDFSVKHTALDALKLGYNTHVVVDGCRGTNFAENDDNKALEELIAANVKLVHSAELPLLPQQQHLEFNED